MQFIQANEAKATTALELRKSLTSGGVHSSLEKIEIMRQLIQLSEAAFQSRVQGCVKVCNFITASVEN